MYSCFTNYAALWWNSGRHLCLVWWWWWDGLFRLDRLDGQIGRFGDLLVPGGFQVGRLVSQTCRLDGVVAAKLLFVSFETVGKGDRNTELFGLGVLYGNALDLLFVNAVDAVHFQLPQFFFTEKEHGDILWIGAGTHRYPRHEGFRKADRFAATAAAASVAVAAADASSKPKPFLQNPQLLVQLTSHIVLDVRVQIL